MTKRLPTRDNTNTEARYTSMLQVELEPMVPVCRQSKAVCAIDCAITVTDNAIENQKPLITIHVSCSQLPCSGVFSNSC
jgi:hypothetical protein